MAPLSPLEPVRAAGRFRTMLCVWTCLLMIGPRAGLCAGQDSTRASGSSAVNTVERDARDMLRGAGHVFTAPLRWGSADWLKAGGVFAISGASSLLDDGTARLMDRNRTPANDEIQKIAVEYGDGYVIFGVFGAGYLAGLYLDCPWLRETAMLTATAVLISGTISTVTKVVVGRARPYAGLGNWRFKPFSLPDQYHAFPSGHTMAAFSVSTVLSDRIGNGWATAGLYAAAATSAFSRSYSREHWLSDIVFAALYSSAVAHSLVGWYEGEQSSNMGIRFESAPGGIAVVYRF